MTNRTIFARSEFKSRVSGDSYNSRAFDRIEDARRWARTGFKWGAVKSFLYYGSTNRVEEVIEEVRA
jgi:hypothetical protein